MNDQFRSELEQLEHYNQYLANEGRKQDFLIDPQKSTLRNKDTKTKATEKCLPEIWNKNFTNRPATLYEILLVKYFAPKDQIRKHYHVMRLLTHLDAGEDKKIVQDCQPGIPNSDK